MKQDHGKKTIDVALYLHDIPVEANRVINTLAVIRGVKKAIIVREALVEYATKHASDIGTHWNKAKGKES